MHKLLKEAQDTYGFTNQITVAVEELCELACVLSKYPRYSTHEIALKQLRNDVVDELADVTIVCKHVEMIFEITPEELETRIGQKLDRLRRWLNTNNSMETTVIDREVR
jgi:NTP pyrophosphatase (non-canonical NTP hydrolase)